MAVTRPTFFIAGDPGIPAGEVLDPFAGLPSAMVESIRAYLDSPNRESDSRFVESKAVGTAPGVSYGHVGQRDARIRDKGHFASTTRFHLRAAATNTIRDFAPVVTQAVTEIGGLLNEWLGGRISYDDVQLRSAKAWRAVYEQVRDLGRKAAGIDRLAPDEQHVTHDEETWFRGAVREELRFWHVFLEDVNDGRTVGERTWLRFDAYVKALRFMYDASRTLAIPEHNTLIYWMGPKKDDPTICEGCLYMIERSPFPKEVMPATPRDGCLTGGGVLVSTRRGQVPLAEVRVGDEVVTHRGRWRAVTERFEHRSRAAHRYVAVVAPGGRLVGLTDDHKVWTREGWVEAREAARRSLRVLWRSDERAGEGGDVLAVRPGSGRHGATPASVESDACVLPLRESGRSPLRAVLGRHGDAVALPLPLPLEVGAGARADSGRRAHPPSERGRDGRPTLEPGVRDAQTASGSSRASSVGGRASSLDVCDVRDGVPALRAEWGSSTLLLDPMPRCELPAAAFDGVLGVRRGVLAERGGSHSSEAVLLSRLLRDCEERGCADPVVRLVSQDLHADCLRDKEVEVGEVLLLASVLPPGEPLYDIAVEDDSSFVADGLVVHNSTPCLTNCRHKIMVRVVGLEEDVRRRKAALPSREVMVRELRRIKEGAHGNDHHRRVRRGAEIAREIHPHAANPFKGHPMPAKRRPSS